MINFQIKKPGKETTIYLKWPYIYSKQNYASTREIMLHDGIATNNIQYVLCEGTLQ